MMRSRIRPVSTIQRARHAHRVGIRSVTSTPLLDEHADVWGIVFTHHCCSQQRTADGMRANQRMANECGRWLKWYHAAVLPTVVDTAQAVAAGLNQLGCEPRGVDGDTDLVAAAVRTLIDRFDIQAPEATKLLTDIASGECLPVVLAAQMVT